VQLYRATARRPGPQCESVKPCTCLSQTPLYHQPFLYIYQLKVFASEKLNSDDLEGDVAGLSILYCHWFSTEGDRMLASELTSISANLVENDVFLKAFNSTH